VQVGTSKIWGCTISLQAAVHPGDISYRNPILKNCDTSNIFLYVYSRIIFRCLKIDTVPDPENPKDVKAVLTVNGPIDWEVFDTLYVNIVAEDKNTHPDYEENRFSIGK
jgi:hypothetical protein